jgi:hypothetical protein
MKWDKMEIKVNTGNESDYVSFEADAREKSHVLLAKILGKDVKKIQDKAREICEIEIDLEDLIQVIETLVLLCNSQFHKNDLNFIVKKQFHTIFLNKISFLLNLITNEDLNVDWLKLIWSVEYFTNFVKDENGALKTLKSKIELINLLKLVHENIKNAEVDKSKTIKNTKDLPASVANKLSSIELPHKIVTGRVKNALWNVGINNMLDLYNYKGKLWDVERVGRGNTVYFLRKYIAEEFPKLSFYCLED